MAEPQPLEAQRNALLKLSRDVLKKRCKNAKLSAEGSKGDLITRLLQSAAPPASNAEAQNQSVRAVSRRVARNTRENERRAEAEAERERQRVQKRARLQKRLRFNATNRYTKASAHRSNVKNAKLQQSLPLELMFAGLSPPTTYQNTTEYSAAVSSLGNYTGCVMFVRTSLTIKSSIGELKQFIRSVYGIDNKHGLMIFYSHLRISQNDSAKLLHFGITNRALLTILVSARTSSKPGGGGCADVGCNRVLARAIKEMKTQRMQTYRGLDIVTQETDVELFRMPVCGHLMNKQSLYYYALNAFSSDQTTLFLRCPHTILPGAAAKAGRSGPHRKWQRWHCMQCTSANVGTQSCRRCRAPQPKSAQGPRASNQCNAAWHFSLLKQILYSPQPGDDDSKNEEFDDDEDTNALNVAKLELLSSRNTLESVHNQKRRNIQKCSKCCSLHFILQARKTSASNRTECVLCRSYFCWNCGDAHSRNHRCDADHTMINLMRILQKCDLKDIGYVSGVPSIRACPNSQCGQLITHVQACKHMKCRSCKLNFCFVCLNPMLRGNWQCGGSSDVCPIAPRQTLKSMKLDEVNKPQKQFQFW